MLLSLSAGKLCTLSAGIFIDFLDRVGWIDLPLSLASSNISQSEISFGKELCVLQKRRIVMFESQPSNSAATSWLPFYPAQSTPQFAEPLLNPQGFDLGAVLSQVLPIAIQTALSTLSASPQTIKPQFAAPQISPQGFDLGAVLSQVLPTVIQTVLSTLSATPQIIKPQSAAPQISPQGFDLGGMRPRV
jgi:hypothetical protein